MTCLFDSFYLFAMMPYCMKRKRKGNQSVGVPAEATWLALVVGCWLVFVEITEARRSAWSCWRVETCCFSPSTAARMDGKTSGESLGPVAGGVASSGGPSQSLPGLPNVCIDLTTVHPGQGLSRLDLPIYKIML